MQKQIINWQRFAIERGREDRESLPWIMHVVGGVRPVGHSVSVQWRTLRQNMAVILFIRISIITSYGSHYSLFSFQIKKLSWLALSIFTFIMGFKKGKLFPNAAVVAMMIIQTLALQTLHIRHTPWEWIIWPASEHNWLMKHFFPFINRNWTQYASPFCCTQQLGDTDPHVQWSVWAASWKCQQAEVKLSKWSPCPISPRLYLWRDWHITPKTISGL